MDMRVQLIVFISLCALSNSVDNDTTTTVDSPAATSENGTIIGSTTDNTNSSDTTTEPIVKTTAETNSSTMESPGTVTTETAETTHGSGSSPTTGSPAPQPASGGFNALSFIGGIVLCLGVFAIGYVGFKFYKSRTERNYHTL